MVFRNKKLLLLILVILFVIVMASLWFMSEKSKRQKGQAQIDEIQRQISAPNAVHPFTFYNPLTKQTQTVKQSEYCLMRSTDSSDCYVYFLLMGAEEKQQLTDMKVLPIDEGMYVFALEDIQTTSGLKGQKFTQKYADTKKYGNTLLAEFYFFDMTPGTILSIQPNSEAGVNLQSKDRQIADTIINSITF